MKSKNCYQNKILKMLDDQKKDKKVSYLFSEFDAQKIQYILIGGAIRDVINDKEPRDIDLILNIDNEEIFEEIILANNIKYKKNNFNGYKLFFDNLSYDIWLLKNHYSFKENYYNKNIKNIKNTTFFNYDSLMFDIRTKYLEVSHYEQCIKEQLIDLVGSEQVVNNNPTPIMNIAKAFKVKKETDYAFSNNLIEYIKKFLDLKGTDNLFYEIMDEYNRHYGLKVQDDFKKYTYNILSILNKSKV